MAKWIDEDGISDFFYCSECDYKAYYFEANHECPNCGSIMDGVIPFDDESETEPEWYIIKYSDNKFRLFSKGLRCYGVFESIKELKQYIEKEKHPLKHHPIIIQDKNGVILDTIF